MASRKRTGVKLAKVSRLALPFLMEPQELELVLAKIAAVEGAGGVTYVFRGPEGFVIYSRSSPSMPVNPEAIAQAYLDAVSARRKHRVR